jgi:hypothetical protein
LEDVPRDNDGHQRSTGVYPNLGRDQHKRRDQHRLSARSLDGMQGVRGSNPLSSTRHKAGRRWRITRLAMEHRAGQGAGDAVHDLDAGDHQPAQLIQTGRLHPGDDVVGADEVLGQLHTIQVAERLGRACRTRSG